jgi:isoquinoline 1-oxidoreductase alpha subunit
VCANALIHIRFGALADPCCGGYISVFPAQATAMPSLNVNGRTLDVQADPATPLLWVLREQLGLTGTKYGCGVAQCGACTVHIDGAAIRSCVLPLSAVQPTQKIVTIEGLSADASHPVQKAWLALDVPQCGYCQSGMIMAAAALLKDKPRPTDVDIDDAITNICRCGTYNRVRAAIHVAADGGTPKQAAGGTGEPA